MSRWESLFKRDTRVVAGVMSGTSLDGIDVALLRLAGSGQDLDMDLIGTGTAPFPSAIARYLRDVAEGETASVDLLCRLGPTLAGCYERAIRETVREAGLGIEDVGLVGCHGQTVRHQPYEAVGTGLSTGTLQLGSGGALSARLGVPVVDDFRAGDVALGGQGAPLVPYVDFILLGSESENRVALNIGGIANLTYLGAGENLHEVVAFDSGPGNMLIDAVCRQMLDVSYDDEGKRASRGQVRRAVVDEVLASPYFGRRPPKSAGRQSDGEAAFGEEFASSFLALMRGAPVEDMLATAVAITVESVGHAIDTFLPERTSVVIASGGGVKNRFLMQELGMRVGKLRQSDEFGVDSHFKEAIAFGILAHEAVNGVATGLPNVTGASRPTVLGSLSWP